MHFYFRLLLLFFLITQLSSCANVRDTPIRTLQDQIDQFHLVIENTNATKHADNNYQSLAYSEMKVFKPASFLALDSVYAIKRDYLDKNDISGVRESDYEYLIPGYRAVAQEERGQDRSEIAY